MGIMDNPSSFVSLLIRDVTGAQPSDRFVSWLSGICAGLALVASLIATVRDRRVDAGRAVDPT
jgi:hypothetical protein